VRPVLAVDGGQSGIRVRHSADPSAVEVGGVSRLEGDTVGSVAAAVIEAWQAMGGPVVDRAILGLPTAPAAGPAQGRLCEAVAAGTRAREVWLADDAVTAHAGALSESLGVSLTVGTGVACLVMPRDGRPRIIGGHGYLIGDEGGAWCIGREGLRAALRAAEGQGQPTALSHSAERRIGSLADLGARLHSLPRPVDAVARFAPEVLDAAVAVDAVARAIAEQATEELVAVAGVAVSVAAAGDGPGAATQEMLVPVALGGRLLEAGPLRGWLDESLARSLPGAMVVDASGSPLDGALRLGESADPGPYRDLVFVWQAAA